MKKKYIFIAVLFMCLLCLDKISAATYTCSTTPLYSGTCSCKKTEVADDTDLSTCNDFCGMLNYSSGTGTLTPTCSVGTYNSSDNFCHLSGVSVEAKDGYVSDGWTCVASSPEVTSYNCVIDGAFYHGSCNCVKNETAEDTDLSTCNDFCGMINYDSGNGSLSPFCTPGMGTLSGSRCYFYNVSEEDKPEKESDGLTCTSNGSGSDSGDSGNDPSPTTYVITLDGNGGTITPIPGWTNSSDNKTATITLGAGSAYDTLPMVTRSGFTFKEYNTKANGTGTVVTASTTATATTTIYAIWNSASSAGEGTISFDRSSYTCHVGDNVLVDVTFNGVNINNATYSSNKENIAVIEKNSTVQPRCLSCIYANIRCLAVGEATVSMSVSGVTAQATVNVVNDSVTLKTIIFNANGGKITVNNVPSDTYEITDADTNTFADLLNGLSITREGYTLAGWYTAAAGGNAVALENQIKGVTETTLYAHWSVAEPEIDPTQPIATLTYNSNGGTACAPATRSVNVGQPWGTLCTPKYKGYKFNGWFTAKNGGTKITSTTIANENITAYAQWRKVTNPNTGIFTPILAILILGVVSSVTFIIVKRKSVGI